MARPVGLRVSILFIYFFIPVPAGRQHSVSALL
ncbi:MAG: hypothetical protein RJA20_2693 [Bacteroidota bacterium]|jgi:hypothetical protein